VLDDVNRTFIVGVDNATIVILPVTSFLVTVTSDMIGVIAATIVDMIDVNEYAPALIGIVVYDPPDPNSKDVFAGMLYMVLYMLKSNDILRQPGLVPALYGPNARAALVMKTLE